MGKTVCGHHEVLAEKADIGSYLAKRGKGSGTHLSPPALPTGDVGRAARGRRSPSPVWGVQADGLPVGRSSPFCLEVAT